VLEPDLRPRRPVGTGWTVAIGAATFLIMLAAFAAFAVWAISVMRDRIVVRFPSPS
jgi:hypothetical protein